MHTLDSGPAVVLLHGIPSPIEYFEPLRAELAKRHRVLVPQLPGYGRTPALEGRPDIPRVRRLLEEFLEQRGVNRVSIVGFSGGAYRALELALAGTVRVNKLVLMAPIATLPEEGRMQFRQLAQMVRAGVDLRDMLPSRMLSARFASENPGVVESVKNWATAAAPAALADELEACSDMADLRPSLGRIDVPTYIRVGALDAAAPVANSEEIHRAIPGSRLDVVNGAGHALLYEDVAATVASVAEWLAN